MRSCPPDCFASRMLAHERLRDELDAGSPEALARMRLLEELVDAVYVSLMGRDAEVDRLVWRLKRNEVTLAA